VLDSRPFPPPFLLDDAAGCRCGFQFSDGRSFLVLSEFFRILEGGARGDFLVLNLVGKDKGYVLEWFRNSFLGAISLEVELVGNWVLLFFAI